MIHLARNPDGLQYVFILTEISHGQDSTFQVCKNIMSIHFQQPFFIFAVAHMLYQVLCSPMSAWHKKEKDEKPPKCLPQNCTPPACCMV